MTNLKRECSDGSAVWICFGFSNVLENPRMFEFRLRKDFGKHPDRHCFQKARKTSCYKCLHCGSCNSGVGLEATDRCKNCQQVQVERLACIVFFG